MSVYIVTGKLGSGKTLVAVSKIQEYLNRGRVVATNLDLYLEHLINPFAKSAKVYRVPDRPNVDDLNALPSPYEGDYDESKMGLLVFDECATWFNSRSWNDKGRKALIDWFIHARKLGWDIIFIIQDVSMMDGQARESLGEHVVYCRRLDRLSIPFFTWFFRLGGIQFRPPKLHWGIVKYGTSHNSPMIERWAYRGTSLYHAYDTKQIFSQSCGLCSMLPPNTVYGRHTNAKHHSSRGFINAVNQSIKNYQPRGAFFLGLMLAGALALIFRPAFLSDDKASAIEKASTTETTEQEPVYHRLSGVFITAAVKYSDGFDYVFETNETVIYPENLGYKVRYISDCKANLYSETESLYLTCFPYRSKEDQPEARRDLGLIDLAALDSAKETLITSN